MDEEQAHAKAAKRSTAVGLAAIVPLAGLIALIASRL